MGNNSFLKENKFLFSVLIPIILLGALVITLTEREKLHIFFNVLVNQKLNLFFKSLTFLGDGYFVVACLIVILFFSFRLFLSGLLSYGLSSLIVQFIKYFIFPDALRPKTYFEHNVKSYKLVLIEGVDTLGLHSFPSGHTAAAFSLFFVLALFCKNNFLKIFFFIMAVLVGFSRIYLSQHFFEDAYAGMIIGVICAIFSYVIFNINLNSSKNSSLDNSIMKLFKKNSND
ncbi:MAG: phosphatase PAP2 family protein [Bacteroidota bacterium]|jgi:membrane-associated phospholipid phosphatase